MGGPSEKQYMQIGMRFMIWDTRDMQKDKALDKSNASWMDIAEECTLFTRPYCTDKEKKSKAVV